MTTYGIYEAAGGYMEPVVVRGWTDAAGRGLDALLLPHELAQLAVYAEVQRNAGAGAFQLVEAYRLHASALGNHDVLRDPIAAHRQLLCATCGVFSEPAIAGLPA